MEGKLSNHLYSIKCLTFSWGFLEAGSQSVLDRSTFDVVLGSGSGILGSQAWAVGAGSFVGSWVGSWIGEFGRVGGDGLVGGCVGLVEAHVDPIDVHVVLAGVHADHNSDNALAAGNCTLLLPDTLLAAADNDQTSSAHHDGTAYSDENVLPEAHHYVLPYTHLQNSQNYPSYSHTPDYP